ncbi:unnamed protein product [Didymodactylos carnosus]|uniref:Tetratricopeptide repeat protein n=1 Tax=Didymodactylos carnosus TaxID=1234261 RepID=A0A814BTY2_9BILA|nr:unnamed protein product [Didymodactylos carnosus]CAF3710117.1 unnamed protein product [Didymodactylos carnosus]
MEMNLFTEEESNELQMIHDLMQNKVGESLTYLTFGNFLSQIGENGLGLKYYQLLLNEIPLDHSSISVIKNNIGVIYSINGQYSAAAKSYDSAFENLKIDHQKILCSDPLTHSEKRQQGQCSSFRMESLATTDDEKFDLSAIYGNIARVYCSERKYDDSLTYYQKALEIAVHALPKDYKSVQLYYEMLVTMMNKKEIETDREDRKELQTTPD